MTVLRLMHKVVLVVKFYPLCSLDGSGITNSGAGVLADFLKVNQSLQNLRSVAPLYIKVIKNIKNAARCRDSKTAKSRKTR